MTADTLVKISNMLSVEPYAVLVATQDDSVKLAEVYSEYMGKVTKMGAFYIPSHARIYAKRLKEDYPMWRVCTILQIKDEILTEVA